MFRVAHLVDHPDSDVREALAYALDGFRTKDAAELQTKLRSDPIRGVRVAAGAEEDGAG